MVTTLMDKDVILLIIGFVGGILTTFLTDWIKKQLLLARIRKADKASLIGIFNYNPEDDDLFIINRWSLERKLTPSNLKISIDNNPLPQDFIPELELEKGTEEQLSLGRAGDICYLTDFSIDHRESEFGQSFCMKIAKCDYSRHMAASQYLLDHPSVMNNVRVAIRRSIRDYVKVAVPSNITVNAVVLSEDKFLACQRSGAVDTAQGMWGVGAFETMTLKKSATTAYDEDLFGFTRRALTEELNLKEDSYGNIMISWFGLYIANARTHIVSIVKIKNITEGEVISNAQNAHSNFETQAYEWLPMNLAVVKEWIEHKTGPMSGREWMPFTALALQEAFRVGKLMDEEL